MDKNDKPQDPPKSDPVKIPLDVVARPGKPDGK